MASFPKKIAIYYGWPIAVNGAWSVAAAVSVFNDYDIVIFGSGLEATSHPEYQSTKDIVDATTAEVYGYIDAVLSVQSIQTKVNQWKVVGGSNKLIKGIFFDQFGFDYGLNRQIQNDIVDYVHAQGMPVFVNAWDPDDVFKKSMGKDTHLTSTDWYLAESHYVKLGDWQPTAEWETKSDKMVSYKSLIGTKMACITTTTGAIGYSSDKWNNAYYAHAVYGFDASGWGEPFFSAPDALLPFRMRPTIEGTTFTGQMVKNNGIFERPTNVGINIDSVNKTYSSIIN